jgi:hypothetical protein
MADMQTVCAYLCFSWGTHSIFTNEVLKIEYGWHMWSGGNAHAKNEVDLGKVHFSTLINVLTIANDSTGESTWNQLRSLSVIESIAASQVRCVMHLPI